MTKILFDTRAWCLDVMPQMQERFLEHPEMNVEPVTVFHNKIEYKRFSNRDTDLDLSEYYEVGRKKYNKNDLIEIEKKYQLVNLWNVVYFDRFLKDKDEDYIIEQLSYYLYAWEQILSIVQPRYAISETVVGAWNYLLFGISKHFNCVYLGFLFTKNTNRYFYARDMFGVFTEMKSKLNDLMDGKLSPGQREEAIIYSDNFQKNFKAPGYLKFFSGVPKIYNLFNPYRISINIAKDINVSLKNKNDYKTDLRIQGYKRDFKRLYRIGYSKIFKVFEKPVENEKFILFPLHFQPEASTEICAAYYNDQYNVIVNLVRSLPFGYKLYVKEHYAVMGTKTVEFYQRIKKLSNVRLIDPLVRVNKLIDSAAAIAVLTGTTGLEAIICKKPVVIFGHVFYDIYPQIYRVVNLEDLPAILKDAVENFKVDEEIYLKYVYSYISSGYDGRLLGGTLSEQDIRLHCKNLLTEIERN